jgi:ribosome-binding factor A
VSSGGRKRRVDEAIRHVLSEALPSLKDPRIGFVTVTGVEATRDFAQATVYVSVFGSEAEQRKTLEGLEAARGVLQAQVARELQLRRTPVLSFQYDPAVERGVRLGKMIDELAPEPPAESPDEPDD